MGTSTVDRVAATITKITGASQGTELNADTPIVGGGISLDSSAVLELLVSIEGEFGVEMNTEELLQAQALRTVGTLAQFIDGKAGRTA